MESDKTKENENEEQDDGFGEGMSPELQQELLRSIQTSMWGGFGGSKHRRARELRTYHRNYSPKARKRKKDRRRRVRASRQQNYRFAKSR